MNGINPAITLPLGSHNITLTVSDGQASETDTVLINVIYDFGGAKSQSNCNQGVGNGPESCDSGNSNLLNNPFD